MIRNIRRDFRSDDGASLVEYSLAVVLIGLVAVVVTSFVGRSTSDAFDEVGNAFPTSAVVASPVVDVPTDASEALKVLSGAVADIKGLGGSLTGKVDRATDRYEAGDVDGALSQLDALSSEVDAQAGKKITVGQAAAIHLAIDEVVDAMGVG